MIINNFKYKSKKINNVVFFTPFFNNKYLYAHRSFPQKNNATKGDESYVQHRKTKNSSYYYYILCRKYFHYPSSSAFLQAKKHNLLGSGRVYRQWKNPELLSSPFSEQTKGSPLNESNSTIHSENNTMSQTVRKKLDKQSHDSKLTISNFTRRIKSLKQNKYRNQATLVGKQFSLTRKSDLKIQNGAHLSNFNKGGFFPYRKSFICYWLLPFVGFVSLGSLSLEKHPMQEEVLYNSFRKAGFNENKKDMLLEKNLLLEYGYNIKKASDKTNTNDFGPEYVLNNNNPFKQVYQAGVTNNKNDTIGTKRLNTGGDNISDKNPSLLSNIRTKESRNNNLNGSVVTETNKHIRLKKDYPSAPNSLKYCMLYLDCLENDLNLFESAESPSENKVGIFSSFTKSNSPEQVPIGYFRNNTFSTRILTYSSIKKQINSGMALYPTSFFNRVSLSKQYFDNFVKAPLKINFNVPLQNNSYYNSQNYSPVSLLLSDGKNSSSGFNASVENPKKISDILHEKIFSSKYVLEKRTSELAFQPYFLIENRVEDLADNITPKGSNISATFPSRIIQSTKQNPVSSFLRASGLLDKYRFYKPIVQDLQGSNALSLESTKQMKKDGLNKNITIKPHLIDKLFSYFSKDSVHSSSPKLTNLSTDTDNLFFQSLKKISTSNFSSKKTAIIFKQLDVLENKRPEKQLSVNLLQGSSIRNSKIYDKLSKEKLYNIVLSTLKATLKVNGSTSFSDIYINGFQPDNISKMNLLPISDSLPLTTEEFRPIKFKHPILMSDKALYPLLCSSAESLYGTKGHQPQLAFGTDQNTSPFQPYFLIENRVEDLADNITPRGSNISATYMLNNISSIVKEKRPLMSANEKNTVSSNSTDLNDTSTKQSQKTEILSSQNILESYTQKDQTQPKTIKKYCLNPYRQLKILINKYTDYAIKDFLILNKISTYIKPISEDYSIKASHSSLKTDIVTLDSVNNSYLISLYESDPKNKNKGTIDSILNKNKPTQFKNLNSRAVSVEKNEDERAIVTKSLYVLNNKIKQSFIRSSFNPKPNPNAILNETVTLRQNYSSKMRKIRKNDKTAKLLRAYFSIKKSSSYSPNNNKLGRYSLSQKIGTVISTKSQPTSVKRLKQKILLNLKLKSYLKYELFLLQNGNRLTSFKNTPNSSSQVFQHGLKNKNGVRFLSSQFNLKKRSTVNEIKELCISPRLLINNRLLMKIHNENNIKTQMAKPAKSSLFANEEILRKRKTIQKKRRITKLKKETRRRKKRMRFFPRPMWLRYRFYSHFLKTRRPSQKLNRSVFPSFNQMSFETFDSTLPKRLRYKERFMDLGYANSYSNSNPILKNCLATPSPEQFPYTTTHSSINISPALMGEFKTAFWKSYWLRSNLKPYFNKIKTSLNDIKETQRYSTHINPSYNHNKDLETQSRFLNNIRDLIIFFLDKNKNIDNVLPVPAVLSKRDVESYYQTANSLAEYNQISSQRIQQFVGQIRENLTLNGNTKVRPSRISINFSGISGSKGLKKKNINLLKRPTLRYNAMSRLRLYWAFSKGTTHLATLPTSLLPGAETMSGHNYNKRKQIWTTEKFRQQTKENKTKKLVKDIKTKLKFVVNETPYFSIENNVPLWNTLILKSIQKMRIQEEKWQNLAFVNNGGKRFSRNLVFSQNNRKMDYRSFLRKKTTSNPSSQKKYFSVPLREFSIRENRLKNSLKQTAKVQPFISGKTHYWWTYNSNTPSVLSGTGLYAQLYGPVRQDNIFNSQIKKGWTTPSLNLSPSQIDMQWEFSALQINTLLFHFCSLITLLSISQIRSFLKFSFILVNKVFTLLERLIPSSFYSVPLSSDSRQNTTSIFGNTPNKNSERAINELGNKMDSHFQTLSSLTGENNLTVGISRKKKGHVQPYFLIENRVEDLADNLTPKGSKISAKWLFDFEKRNDSFLYAFYTNNNQKSIKSGTLSDFNQDNTNIIGNSDQYPMSKEQDSREFTDSASLNFKRFDLPQSGDLQITGVFIPRLKIENSSKVINDSQNIYIKPTINEFFLTREPSTGLASFDKQNNSMVTDKTFANLSKTQNSLFPFLSIASLYSLLTFLVKKPIYMYYKWFRLNQKIDFYYLNFGDSVSEPSIKNTQKGLRKQNSNTITTRTKDKWDSSSQIQNLSILYILLVIRFGLNRFSEVSENGANLLGQRTKLEAAFRSIYGFFEKPGVLIVDWIAYLFLVEWASDITTTLPEKVDTQITGSPFNKLTRTIYNIYPFLPWSQSFINNVYFKSVMDSDVTSRIGIQELTSRTTFLTLASTFLKRRIYHLYEILLLQFYQPDTDLLVRQKKGIVFWDIWGDFLTQTAEDSNINISELTSLKEEQMKLLENASVDIQNDLSTTSQKSVKKVLTNVKKKKSLIKSSNSNFANTKALSGSYFHTRTTNRRLVISSQSSEITRTPSSNQKLYSKVSSISPLKYFLTNQAIQTSLNSSPLHSSTHKVSGLQVPNTTAIITSLKPAIGSLGMPSKPLFGVPLKETSQNLNTSLHQWGSQQFLSYAIKSKDTELFIDLHPPRALSSVLKNKQSSQQLRAISPMGSLVCQIFAGILYKQISKNILIVGAKSSLTQNKKQTQTKGTNTSHTSPSLNDAGASLEKTLLVQAIAGETELKIITDNAYRYALVYRGVAVGIKLLRDVFDSLSLQTPCFFLIEDIHAIGERRPFLISDDSSDSTGGSTSQNTEIHEKNQVLYQLSKHVISHYKKPYKGDFSLSIPTNHFCFDFFKGRNQNSLPLGKASIARQNTVSPKILQNSTSEGVQEKPNSRILPSRLLRPSTELLSPPATSPFSVLTLKEEKKLKTHKTVADLPWTGRIISTSQGQTTNSQDSQKTGPAYSIRAKVALLADIAISSLSVKLDMITDLLVIIDSVKGNRGFVVFATTHIPFVLDPALRRPGRLDETISFGFSSKSHPWEVSQFGILNVPRFNYPTTQNKLSSIVSGGLNIYPSLGRRGGGSLDFSLTSTGIDTNTVLGRLCQTAVKTHSFSHFTSDSYLKRTSSLFHFFDTSLFNNRYSQSSNMIIQKIPTIKLHDSSLPTLPVNKHEMTEFNYPNTTQILAQVAIKASAYFNSTIQCVDHGQTNNIKLPTEKPLILNSDYLAKDQPHLDLYMENALTQLPDLSLESPISNSSHLSMYASPHFFKKNISVLISGKIGEFFLFSNTSQLAAGVYKNNDSSSKDSGKVPYLRSHFSQNCKSVRGTRRSSLMPVLTESISSLVLSFVQKRFLYKSNLMVSTLFNLTNYSALIEPSSPPISSILLPAKRYENLKRSLSYYQNHDYNSGSGIMEKINLHQQQRLVKRLYNIPLKESFQSEIIENRLSSFSNASLMIGSMTPSRLQKTSTSNWFIRNRIFTRHSHYLTNQWWTAQLPEHNAETTFLSDIDWRYTFVEREARDILLDFPDADQHYNPRNRRWVAKTQSIFGTIEMSSLTSSFGSNNKVLDKQTNQTDLNNGPMTEKSFYSDIYSHFIYDSFIKAFNIYEQNREVFDYYAFHVCKQGLHCHLHEFERLKLIQRFLQN